MTVVVDTCYKSLDLEHSEDESPEMLRRVTLPAVHINISDAGSSSDDSNDSFCDKKHAELKTFRSSPNLRRGFRRRGCKKKGYNGSESPNLSDYATPSDTPTSLCTSPPFSPSQLKSRSEEDLNSLEESSTNDHVPLTKRISLTLPPQGSLPLSSSPGARRRSSILNALTGMFESRSQSNLSDPIMEHFNQVEVLLLLLLLLLSIN